MIQLTNRQWKSDWTELIKKRREALRTFVVGKGVFVRTLPTGFGQSLCYALIPLVFDVLQGGESGRRSSLQHMKSVDELQQDLDTMENVKGGKSALY